ncbi:MAG TPA: hypothetical protein VIP27_08070 [Variovorax sp.]
MRNDFHIRMVTGGMRQQRRNQQCIGLHQPVHVVLSGLDGAPIDSLRFIIFYMSAGKLFDASSFTQAQQ